MLSTDTGPAQDNLESGASRTNKDRPQPSGSGETAQALTGEGESSSLRISRPSVICSLECEDRTLPTTTSRRVSYLPLINLQDSLCSPANEPVQTVDVFCWKNQQQLFLKTGELHQPFDKICRRGGDCESSVNWERRHNKYYCTAESCVNHQCCMWYPQFERFHWLPCCCISSPSQGYRHVTNMRANQKSVYFYPSRRSEETLKESEWHCKQLDGANTSFIDDRNSKKPRKDQDGSSNSSSVDGSDSGGCDTMLFGQNVRKNEGTTQEDRERTTLKPCLDEPQREGGSIEFKQKGEEANAHPPPWLCAKKTIRQAYLSESLQAERGSIAFKQEGEETKSHPPPWPRGKKTIFKSPICVSRVSRINGGPSSWNHTSKRNSITTNQDEATEGTACPVCKKKLKRSYYLKSHMLIHTGDKPYKCAYCSKAFNQIGNRNAHQRIHTGEKPYACDYCGKRFIFNSSKHNHMTVHGVYCETSTLDEPLRI